MNGMKIAAAGDSVPRRPLFWTIVRLDSQTAVGMLVQRIRNCLRVRLFHLGAKLLELTGLFLYSFFELS